ncbi:MAG: hypothetical protein ABIG92_03695 [Candidatus Omnitrophota bacterium]
MSKIVKIFFISLIAISIISISFAYIAYLEKDKEYKKRILLEDKIAQTLKDRLRLEEEIILLQAAKKELDEKNKDISSRLDSVSSQLKIEKSRNRSVKLDLSNRDEDISRLKDRLEDAKKEKLNTEKRLEELQVSYQNITRDYTNLKNQKMILEQKVAELEKKPVDLDRIVLKTQQAETPDEHRTQQAEAPSEQTRQVFKKQALKDLLRGNVVVVNKEYAFVVTDLGLKDGVRPGMLMEIRGSGRLLGEAEVDKVYDTMSSANLLEGSDVGNIKRGNLVIESR